MMSRSYPRLIAREKAYNVESFFVPPAKNIDLEHALNMLPGIPFTEMTPAQDTVISESLVQIRQSGASLQGA